MEQIEELLTRYSGEFLTTDEVEDLFKLPQGSLKEWRKLNIGPKGFKFSTRTYRYLKTDVAEWVKEAYSK